MVFAVRIRLRQRADPVGNIKCQSYRSKLNSKFFTRTTHEIDWWKCSFNHNDTVSFVFHSPSSWRELLSARMTVEQMRKVFDVGWDTQDKAMWNAWIFLFFSISCYQYKINGARIFPSEFSGVNVNCKRTKENGHRISHINNIWKITRCSNTKATWLVGE